MPAPKRIKTRTRPKSQVKGISNLEREFRESWNTDYVQPALQDMVKKKSKKKKKRTA